MLNSGSKIFFLFFFLAVLISLSFNFYRKGVLKNFEIFTDEEVFQEELKIYFEE